MKLRHAWPIPLLLAAAMCIAQTPPPASAPAAPPKFTIGKDTTLIDGPLNPDGTINYAAAINKLLGDGITNEKNAAIPLMDVQPLDPQHQQDWRIFYDALRAPMPAAGAPRLMSLNDFRNSPAAPPGSLPQPGAAFTPIMIGPEFQERLWAAPQFPIVSAWLSVSEPALRIVEQACDRRDFFIPVVAPAPADSFAAASFPTPRMFSQATTLLSARAMFRAGSGDFAAAMDDLHRMDQLAAFARMESLSEFHDEALKIHVAMFKGLAAVANAPHATPAQLKQARDFLASCSPLDAPDKTRASVAELLTLNLLMHCIRDGGREFQTVWTVGLEQAIDMGDFGKINWDAALRAVVTSFSAEANAPDRSFPDRLANLDAQVAAAEKTIPIPITNGASSADRETARTQLERYLKIQPTESVDDYSRRVVLFVAFRDPAALRRWLLAEERWREYRGMAGVAISLAEYKAAHGNYPDSLHALPQPIFQDALSGKDILYQKGDTGFTLWSVGPNRKDDGGTGDDYILRTGW